MRQYKATAITHTTKYTGALPTSETAAPCEARWENKVHRNASASPPNSRPSSKCKILCPALRSAQQNLRDEEEEKRRRVHTFFFFFFFVFFWVVCFMKTTQRQTCYHGHAPNQHHSKHGAKIGVRHECAPTLPCRVGKGFSFLPKNPNQPKASRCPPQRSTQSRNHSANRYVETASLQQSVAWR